LRCCDRGLAVAVAGIDIGSRSIELVVLEGPEVVASLKAPTTFDPMAQCKQLMQGFDLALIVATGYGRKLFAERFGPGVQTITEIQAYALGAKYLCADVRTVLDIGGQDTKAIALGPHGEILKFEMNDRCAAGTGKFLEFMAAALGLEVEEFGEFALKARGSVKISSMCTVFAESEAVSLVAKGQDPASIARGLHEAIARRTLAMLGRVSRTQPILFAGGVARNKCMRRVLEEALGTQLVVPDQPEMVGALGAALKAYELEQGLHTAGGVSHVQA